MILITVIIIAVISTANSYEIIQGEVGNSTAIECSKTNTTFCTLIHRPEDYKSYTVVDRNNTKNQRFSIRNSESCIIDVAPIELNDTTRFYCRTDTSLKEYFFEVYAEPLDEYMIYNGKMLIGKEIIISHNKGQDAYFECHSYQAYPNPHVYWYVDNYRENQLKKVENEINQFWDVKSSILIKPLTLKYHVSCVINYGYGGRKTTITAKFAISSDYIQFKETSKISGSMILVNEVKEITCKTNGVPPPNMLIKRKIKNEWKIVAMKSDHLLKYNVIDSGIYICQVQYQFGVDRRNLTSDELIFRNYGKDQEEIKKTLSNLENKMEDISKMFKKIEIKTDI